MSSDLITNSNPTCDSTSEFQPPRSSHPSKVAVVESQLFSLTSTTSESGKISRDDTARSPSSSPRPSIQLNSGSTDFGNANFVSTEHKEKSTRKLDVERRNSNNLNRSSEICSNS